MGKKETHKTQYTRSLIEASLDPLVTISTEGKITDMNMAMTKITGTSRDKLIGTNFVDCFTEPQKAMEVYEQVFNKGSIADKALSFRHKNGNVTDVLFNGSVYKDVEGNVVGAVVVARDIAEQKWAMELATVNNELAFQNDEKEKRAAELILANKELIFQNKEKEKRATELILANKELVYQNQEKEKRAIELIQANKKLLFETSEKKKRAAELILANKELIFQNKEKEKRATELILANKELVYQNQEKEKRANELIQANKELLFETGEKKKRAAELVIADKELVFQTKEKGKRAAELAIADKELLFQNEEKEKRLAELRIANYARSLIEASYDPLFTISLKGKITDMNNASINITGKSREELIGSDFFSYFTEPKKARKVYQEVFSQGYVSDYPLVIKDHKRTDVLFNGSVYRDDKGNVIGAVVVARDITEQKKIENELLEAIVIAELATAIAEKAKGKAEEATSIAENAVKAKQQFLSNMSHEIRTPMNAIIGFTKVILKTELTAKQKEYLMAIKMSGNSMIVLINDILDLAKVDAGKMTFEKIPFKMSSSVSAMIHLFEIKIHEKNLEFITEYDNNIPSVVIGDPVRLHQIIQNLISNAIKFTSKGKITVAVRLIKEDEKTASIEFSVSDTGIGIAADKLSRIFENFQQASSHTSRLFGGTGLGLAIVKHLVEPQGGKITVKSKLGEGSTFKFVLSFLKTTDEAEVDSEILELDAEVKDIKVLVVEDIALNQLLLKTLLDEFGFERDIAANGKIAIEKMKTKDYDIILMDLQMPVMNGFEATDYIRNKLKSKIPIIALTADVTTVDMAKCNEVGMNDYIAKPVDERVLYRKIISLVKKKGLCKPLISKDSLNIVTNPVKHVDLHSLNRLTNSDPKLMIEMISLYLEQTPPLILAMKQSLKNKDWALLHDAVHKMIPSFSIMGISIDSENMAKKIQEYSSSQDLDEDVLDMVRQLDNVCSEACKELEIELNSIKNKNK